MLEFLIAILWVVTTVLFIATVIAIWMVLVDALDKKVCIVLSVITLTAASLLTFCSIKMSIIEARATITTFQQVKDQKKELDDSYVLEPSILKKYSEALQIIEKYKALGIIKD